MSATALADVIVPEIFNPYVIERTAERSVLFTSGIVASVADLDMTGKGGKLVQMPFWQDLGGDDQLLDDETDLTVEKINAAKDVAVLHARALVYGGTDLSAALAGDDPLRAVADLTADKWSRRMQALLIATLGGSMSAVSANVFDISGLSGAAANFDGEAFIDALGRLGDQEMGLTGIAVHSATYRSMKKQDLIDFLPDSEGKATIPQYQGKTVIVDDTMPVASGGVYTTYLFGPGAIGYGEGSPKVPSESDREALKNGGEDYLISRRHFVLHPRGIAWTPQGGVPVKATPSNTEVADVGNWTRKYEQKNIRIVQFKHKIAA